MNSTTTIGADIEFFLVDENGAMVSAEGLIGGTKENPLPVTDGALQEDGLLCEINIDPLELVPENCDEFIRRITSVMSQASELTGYKLVASPTMRVPVELQKTRAFQVLGCDRDRNLYSGTLNKMPSARATYRTTGGHIHIGHDDKSPKNLSRFIMALDKLAYNNYSGGSEWERRQLYGSYGSFRIKPYGVEVRTLSSTWTRTEEEMRRVFNLMVEVDQGMEMIQFNPGIQFNEVVA